MSVQFYPAYNPVLKADAATQSLFVLDVSVFNAQSIFEMLGIQGTGEQGTGEQGTVGSVPFSELIEVIHRMHDFDDELRWVNLGWDHIQAKRYINKLTFLMGFCIGNSCDLCWS